MTASSQGSPLNIENDKSEEAAIPGDSDAINGDGEAATQDDDKARLKAIPRTAGAGDIRVRVAGQSVDSFGHRASAATVPNQASSLLCSRLFPVERYPKCARKCRSRSRVSAASYARSLRRTGKARQRAASIPNSTSRGA